MTQIKKLSNFQLYTEWLKSKIQVLLLMNGGFATVILDNTKPKTNHRAQSLYLALGALVRPGVNF